MKLTVTRQLTAVLALCFLFAVPPAPATAADAADDSCWACAMCYENISCLSCGILALNSLSACCGLGNGDTYCVPEYGGFAVNCESGRACQCDTHGDNCDPLTLAGG